MPGTGKSTVPTELKERGHHVVDTDDPGWSVASRTPDGREPARDLEATNQLIDAHRMDWPFMAGCVPNQGAVYDRLDAIVSLSAPIDVILDRVANRADPFGSKAEERAKIANDLEAFEPPLRAGADHELVIRAGP